MKKTLADILIIDDDQSVLKSLEIILSNEFKSIKTLKSPKTVVSEIQQNNFDIVLLDMNFTAGINTGNEGLFWLSEILKSDPDMVVIMLTAYGDIALSVEAMKRGATDFITKPWENERLITTIKSGLKLRKSKKEIKSLKQTQEYIGHHDPLNYQPPIGSSSVFLEILNTVKKVAQTDANILILGENGTGKELIAKEIHKYSKRSKEVFITLDMTSINDNLFESELFGHTKGSFTDAKEERMGRIESASGGTLFLDEIGNLNMNLQAKLLTVIQNKEVIKVGSNISTPVNLRLISATNKKLDKMITDNFFREDLLYRINTIQIELPPLRKRAEDIPELTHFFLNRYIRKYNKQNLKINKKAIGKLQEYHWPGNIRELQHSIEKAVILSESDNLDSEDFYFPNLKQNIEIIESYNLEEMEKNTIKKALIKCQGNISKTSELLGVTRKTLYKKIDKYGL